MQKPSLPKGTRDFSSTEVNQRNYIKNTIQQQFERFGFTPIETPSFENLSVLTGKYGEEGDQLIFKILNSGDYLKKVSNQELSNRNLSQILPKISDKALRYDLTIPFARYVVQNQNLINMPFKRYQIQPVWRADKPQKGRYREFYQCDADVVGTQSLWAEVDFILLYDSVFTDLGLAVQIQINNRKILYGLAQIAGISNQLTEFTVALDKLDKIGADKVKEEMQSKGIGKEAINILQPLFEPKEDFQQQIQQLKTILTDSELGMQGIQEIEFIYKQINKVGLQTSDIQLNTTLARGLNYYTGTILEVKAKNIHLGSIGGGGRYDDLTGVFGLKNVSGVGISFGLDRIYLALEEKQLFPTEANQHLDVLFLNLGEPYAEHSLKLTQQLRQKGYKASMYPDDAKLKKQITYANKTNAKHIAILAEQEYNNQQITIKNMQTGNQQTIPLPEAINFLVNQL